MASAGWCGMMVNLSDIAAMGGTCGRGGNLGGGSRCRRRGRRPAPEGAQAQRHHGQGRDQRQDPGTDQGQAGTEEARRRSGEDGQGEGPAVQLQRRLHPRQGRLVRQGLRHEPRLLQDLPGPGDQAPQRPKDGRRLRRPDHPLLRHQEVRRRGQGLPGVRRTQGRRRERRAGQAVRHGADDPRAGPAGQVRRSAEADRQVDRDRTRAVGTS